MRGRLGLRSRILALTLPVVVLVSAALAGIVYFSLGQVLRASAEDVARAEAAELRTELLDQSAADVLSSLQVVDGNRVVQIVDATTDDVIASTEGAPDTPMATPRLAVGQERVGQLDAVEGQDPGRWVVAAADASSVTGKRLLVLVAVPTRVESTALGQSAEFAAIGAIGLVAVLGAVTTFAVGQALRPVERMRDQVEAIGDHPCSGFVHLLQEDDIRTLQNGDGVECTRRRCRLDTELDVPRHDQRLEFWRRARHRRRC